MLTVQLDLDMLWSSEQASPRCSHRAEDLSGAWWPWAWGCLARKGSANPNFKKWRLQYICVSWGSGVDPTLPYPLESRAQDWSLEDLLQVERPLVSKELHFTLEGVVHGSESQTIREVTKHSRSIMAWQFVQICVYLEHDVSAICWLLSSFSLCYIAWCARAKKPSRFTTSFGQTPWHTSSLAFDLIMWSP